MGSKGFLESSELIVPISEIVGKSLDVILKTNDLALEIKNFILRFSDSVIKIVNLSVVFGLSFLFSSSFLIKAVLFSSQEIIDNFQNGANLSFKIFQKLKGHSLYVKIFFFYEFLISLSSDFLSHLHENLEEISARVRRKSGN